ncbi:MAG: TetR/AcrR family transcriptional regulator [Hyphomonas sp.]|nr:TetR/AcrR family transcriptional regulator [Hyphomonas sp.]
MLIDTLAGAPRPDKRGIIISEAIKLFNSNGFADTRLEDIGERLGTTKTSISYHFKSKEGLLLEVYDNALDFSETALKEAESLPSGREAILYWVRAHAFAHARALSGIAAPLALISEFPQLGNDALTAVEARHRALLTRCREFLLAGRKDGSVNVRSVDATHFYLMNVIHWLPRWLSEVRPADYEQAIGGLIDVLTHGLSATPNRPPAPPIIRSVHQDLDAVFDRDAHNRMKREALLRTGTRALNTHGFRNLSLNDVAAELGVTRGAFYYHFSDKEALLKGCFERSCDLVEAAQHYARKDGSTGLDILERALRHLFEGQVSNLDPLVRVNLLGALEPKSRILIEAKLKRLKSEFADIIAMGMVDDSMRTLELAASEQLVMGAIFAGNQRRFAFTRPDETGADTAPSFAANDYFEVLFHGLEGRKA